MRVLQLVTRRQHRGAEMFATQLSDELTSAGHEVVVVGLYPPPAQRLTPSRASVVDLTGSPSVPLSPGLLRELGGLARRVRPDVVQANGSATLKYASLTKRVTRARWPLVYRNVSMASHWLRFPAHRWWGRWLLGSVGHVAAVSQRSRDDFRRTYGVPPRRITTIPIGVKVPARPERERNRARMQRVAALPADADIVFHCGSFTPEKNHRWLVDCFAHLARQRATTHLVLAGDGPLRREVEADIRARRLDGRIHLLGTRDDIPELVGGADVFVLPSTTEGISGAILEAAAQAIPTVATDVGSVCEAVCHDRTGILVRPGDTPGFVAAVAGLLEDGERRRRMGQAAHRFVGEHYAMDRIVSRFEGLYIELLAQGRTRRGEG